MPRKVAYTFQIETEQLAQLKLIADASRGKPTVSGLLRDAIDSFVERAVQDKQIAEAFRRAQYTPRLIAVGQNPRTERGNR